jgi:hypothetical protein
MPTGRRATHFSWRRGVPGWGVRDADRAPRNPFRDDSGGIGVGRNRCHSGIASPIFDPSSLESRGECAGMGPVAQGDCSPRAPTDPYEPNEGIRLVKSRLGLRTAHRVDGHVRRKRITRCQPVPSAQTTSVSPLGLPALAGCLRDMPATGWHNHLAASLFRNLKSRGRCDLRSQSSPPRRLAASSDGGEVEVV